MFLGTQYSEWIPVPTDRNTIISEIVEGKKFQIRTDKRIDGSNDIRWTLQGGTWFNFGTGLITSRFCNNGYSFTALDQQTKGFFQKDGVLTFLKTSTQLQIWFDDVLEVTWVYEDNDAENHCVMRKPMTGLKFKTPAGKEDKVSTHYRYETGTLAIATARQKLMINCTSGRWQAPAAVLPPEGSEDKGHGHSRARRAREWPKHASPRARRARGRAKLSARFGACQCYYMFFTIQPKIAIFMAQFKYLNDGQNA